MRLATWLFWAKKLLCSIRPCSTKPTYCWTRNRSLSAITCDVDVNDDDDNRRVQIDVHGFRLKVHFTNEMESLFKKWADPASFSLIFRLFKQTIQFLQQINVKNVMFIQYSGPGFEPTTSWTWVVSHNHYTRAPALNNGVLLSSRCHQRLFTTVPNAASSLEVNSSWTAQTRAKQWIPWESYSIQLSKTVFKSSVARTVQMPHEFVWDQLKLFKYQDFRLHR